MLNEIALHSGHGVPLVPVCNNVYSIFHHKITNSLVTHGNLTPNCPQNSA